MCNFKCSLVVDLSYPTKVFIVKDIISGVIENSYLISSYRLKTFFRNVTVFSIKEKFWVPTHFNKNRGYKKQYLYIITITFGKIFLKNLINQDIMNGNLHEAKVKYFQLLKKFHK